MPEYRVYVVGSDGHFINAFELECADDTEAMERAKQLVNGHEIELCQRVRKITVLRRTSPGAMKSPALMWVKAGRVGSEHTGAWNAYPTTQSISYPR